MRADKKHCRKPLFTDQSEAITFLNLFTDFDEEIHIKVAKLIFIDGLTNEEVADIVGYSQRHIERLRSQMVRVALKRAVKRLVGDSNA